MADDYQEFDRLKRSDNEINYDNNILIIKDTLFISDTSNRLFG